MDFPKKLTGKNKAYSMFVGGAKTVLWVLILICFCVFCVFLARKAYSVGFQAMAYTPVSEAPGQIVAVTVTEDMSVKDIGEMLERNGLINESIAAFIIQEYISEYHGKEVPGTYTLNTSMTVDELLAVMSPAPEEESSGN